jgi:hypothetical protein
LGRVPLWIEDGRANLLYDDIRRLENLMLPHAADPPAKSFKSLRLGAVPPAILDQLP